jgi:hypothetical protein
MIIDCDSPMEIEAAQTKAESRFWHTWLIGESESSGKPSGVFYKPTGVNRPWEDLSSTSHTEII